MVWFGCCIGFTRDARCLCILTYGVLHVGVLLKLIVLLGEGYSALGVCSWRILKVWI